MKKNYVLKLNPFFFLLLISLSPLSAQKIITPPNGIIIDPSEVNTPLNDCSQPTAQAIIDVNNVSAQLLVGGDLWWTGYEGRYQVPKPAVGETGPSAIFAGSVWMGGIDAGGNLKLAAQTYGTSSGTSDFWPGPLDENGEADYMQCDPFDRFWETTSNDINTHIADWDDNEFIDGPVPESILAWAGAGNPESFSTNGFVLPSNPNGLAPFFDRNGNGIYEPMSGDYPDINGADQAYWWVFNDAGNIHTQSGGDQLHMETQVLAYAFASTNDNINNATFYDYKFINKSTEVLDSTYIGFWVDFDLGCYLDDYVGCDPSQNLAYVYNQDAIDGNVSCVDCQGIPTYCEDIPIVGLKILEGVKGIENNEVVDRGMSSFIYFNNGGISPPPPPGTTDPESPIQFYNYLTGSFADGTRLTTGGDGYDPASTDYTNYAYPDPPNDPNGWSMCSENFQGSDQRVVIGSGPYTAQPGSVNTLSFAVIYADGITYPCPSIDPLTEAAEDVQGYYLNSVGTKETLAESNANIQFQPNPMSNQAELIFMELENEVQRVEVFSIDGRRLQSYENINGNSLIIQRGDLSSGIYFYKLLTDDFKIHSGKFIVQ